MLLSLICILQLSYLQAQEVLLPNCLENNNMREIRSRAWWVKNAEPKYTQAILDNIKNKKEMSEKSSNPKQSGKIYEFDLKYSKDKDTFVVYDYLANTVYSSHGVTYKRTFITLNNKYDKEEGKVILDEENNTILTVRGLRYVNIWMFGFINQGKLKYIPINSIEEQEVYGVTEGMVLSFLGIENQFLSRIGDNEEYKKSQCINEFTYLFTPISLEEFTNQDINVARLLGRNPRGKYVFVYEQFLKSYELQKKEGKPAKEEEVHPSFLVDPLKELDLLDTPKYRAVRGIAKKMLDKKMDKQTIIEVTGLSDIEIDALEKAK